MSESKTETILGYALMYWRLGFSIFPLKPRSKQPAVKTWKPYQIQPPELQEVELLFKEKDKNIAIVTGTVSGNLVVIDFDSEELFREVMKKIIEKGSTRLKEALANTWIVKTGKGYHVYVRLEDSSLVPRTKPRLREGLDIKAEGGYVVAPPSIHPSGKQYEFLRDKEGVFGPPEVKEPITLTEREGKEFLGFLAPKKIIEEKQERGQEGRCKGLGKDKILAIVEAIKPAYTPGSRDLIVLYLSGWLRKANVCYEDARELIETLASNDEEFNQRIYVLDRTYGLRGNPPSKEELRGKTGLQEILETSLGEEKALDVIRVIEENLGVSSPYRDAVIEILDYEKQLYAVSNLRKLVVVRARRDTNGLRYKERIVIGAPTRVIVYVNPLGGITKYEVVWEVATRPRALHIGPAPIEDIVDRLKAEGLVLNHRLVKDIVNAVIEGYIRKGKAEIKEEIESPGFYKVEKRIIVVRWDITPPSKDELKEALSLLTTLGEDWFKHTIERFITAIKWWMIAPFNYIYKQSHRWYEWLYLYGPPDTGKSTLNKLGLSIWGLPLLEKPGSTIDTPARIGHILSSTTFPTAVKEPGGLLTKESVLEIIKSSIEDVLARGKIIRGTYTEIPALSPLAFSSNKYLPKDEALLKRLLVIKYTWGERIPKERIKKFKQEIEPQFHKLAAVGKWIANRIVNEPKLLDLSWKELADKLLEEMYQEAELQPPEWIKLWYEKQDNYVEETTEAIRSYLIKRINEEYSRFVGRVMVSYEKEDKVDFYRRDEVDFRTRVEIVLKNKLLPWAIIKDRYVIFTTEFARELGNVIGDIGGLKSIAELLGWEYGVHKIGKKSIRGAFVKMDELIEFLGIV